MTAAHKPAHAELEADTLALSAERVVVRRPSGTLAEKQRRQKRRRQLEHISAIAVPLAVLVLWFVSVHRAWVDPLLYPSPEEIVEAAVDLLKDGTLWTNFRITGVRILEGFVLGAAPGMVAGFMMGSIPFLRAALEPSLNALYVVPKIALIPVFITIFGIGELSLVTLEAVTVFFFVWIYTMEAVVSVPEGYRDAARSCGAGKVALVLRVLTPASLPTIFVGLRVAMGVAVLTCVAAEFIQASSGLGYLIINSQNLFIPEYAYLGILCIALMGVALAWLVSCVSRLVCPWQPRQSSRRGLRT